MAVRFPLFVSAAGWQSGHAAACKAVDAGSIPTPALPFFTTWQNACGRPGGETARRKGLKIPRPKGHTGWSPVPGTIRTNI